MVLKVGEYYWATAKDDISEMMIVQVSSAFGEDPEYWTLAVVGSDQHHMPGDFIIIAHVERLTRSTIQMAAE